MQKEWNCYCRWPSMWYAHPFKWEPSLLPHCVKRCSRRIFEHQRCSHICSTYLQVKFQHKHSNQMVFSLHWHEEFSLEVIQWVDKTKCNRECWSSLVYNWRMVPYSCRASSCRSFFEYSLTRLSSKSQWSHDFSPFCFVKNHQSLINLTIPRVHNNHRIWRNDSFQRHYLNSATHCIAFYIKLHIRELFWVSLKISTDLQYYTSV